MDGLEADLGPIRLIPSKAGRATAGTSEKTENKSFQTASL